MKTIKLLLVAVLLAGTFTSCSGDEEIFCDDNCGTILSDNVSDYSVRVKNSCTGNIETFYLEPSDWLTAFVGSDICFSNANRWKGTTSKKQQAEDREAKNRLQQ